MDARRIARKLSTRSRTVVWPVAIGAAFGLTSTAALSGIVAVRPQWTPTERATLRSLALSSLGPLPPDPSNAAGDDPRAAALGRALFFDTRLSGNGKVSCATCHVPTQDFQDGKPLAHGVGTTARRTMPIAGTAHSAWFFWDGRADSQWAQALGPLESAVEHGGTRAQYAHVIAKHYRAEYEAVFGRLPSLDDVPAQAGPVADESARVAGVASRRRGSRTSAACTPTSARPSPRTSGASRSRRRGSTVTSTPSSPVDRTRLHRLSLMTKRPDCGSSSARRTASTVTTGPVHR